MVDFGNTVNVEAVLVRTETDVDVGISFEIGDVCSVIGLETELLKKRIETTLNVGNNVDDDVSCPLLVSLIVLL